MGLRTIIQSTIWKIDDHIKKKNGAEVAHYIHIGKTGGTAFKYALSNQKDEERRQVFDHTIIYIHGHHHTIEKIPNGEKVFFFLRDPIKRFVSGFYERYPKSDHPTFPWSKSERAAFNQFKTPNELACALSSQDKLVRDQAIAAMNGIEHIRQPLIFWVKSIDYFKTRLQDLFFIGFQENLNDDFLTLKEMLRLPQSMQLPPRDGSLSNITPKSFDKNLSPEAKANLRQWYTKDYQLIQIVNDLEFN